MALRKSLSAITAKNMNNPIEGPYAGPNTRVGLAAVCVWHAADHYGQMTLYLRLNGIVPPASRPNPPKLRDFPAQWGHSSLQWLECGLSSRACMACVTERPLNEKSPRNWNSTARC